MSTKNFRMNGSCGIFAVAAMLTVGAGANVAHAADTEAFEPQYLETRRPNVLFLVDSTTRINSEFVDFSCKISHMR